MLLEVVGFVGWWMMERNLMIYCAQCGRTYGVIIPVYCACGEPLSDLEPIIWPATWSPPYHATATRTYYPALRPDDHTTLAPTTPWYTQANDEPNRLTPVWPMARPRLQVNIPPALLFAFQRVNFRYGLLAALMFALLALGASSTRHTLIHVVTPVPVARPASLILPAPATPSPHASTVSVTPQHKGSTPNTGSAPILAQWSPLLIAPGSSGDNHHHHKEKP
jgi:hypothetical protein